jgi:SanA protein
VSSGTWRRLALVAGIAVLPPVVWLLAAHVWIAIAGASDGDVGDRDVVIVPGAAVHRGGPSPVLADRLECAIDLYRRGQARRILVSGDHGDAGYDEVNTMRRYLLARGVADRDVFLDHAGFRTLDTMERAARIFGVERAVICTQELHAARSVFLARRAGIDAVARISDRRDYAGGLWRPTREMLAVGRAAIDAVVGTGPAVLGRRVPIDGDAAASHDRWTAPL